MSAAPPPWQAALALGFRHDGVRTVLARRWHRGPLRIQKLLYPQAGGPCHALLVHPPSGIASGDVLKIEVDVAAGAAVLMTTPGAGKWYRSRGPGAGARQEIVLTVDTGGALEWLPPEAVVHDGARAAQSLQMHLQPGARLLGWDVVQLGLPACGERFLRGHWVQQLSLACGGVLVWQENAALEGNDPLLLAAQGLDGMSVFGTLWACAPEWPSDVEALLHAVRALLPVTEGPLASVRATATWLPAPAHLLLVRGVAPQVEPLRMLFQQAWALLRPGVIGAAPEAPRIWST